MERRELERATRLQDHAWIESCCVCDHFEDIHRPPARIVMKETARCYRLGFDLDIPTEMSMSAIVQIWSPSPDKTPRTSRRIPMRYSYSYAPKIGMCIDLGELGA